MKVGDKVWLFDGNRRIYRKGENSPVFSEYFYQVTIEGETSRSWIIDSGKFSKKTLQGIYTDEKKADAIWEQENRFKIRDKIWHCSIPILKQINGLLIKEQPDAKG